MPKLNNTIFSDSPQFLYENWESGNRMYCLGYLMAKQPHVAAYLAIAMTEIARTNGTSHIFAADFRAMLEQHVDIEEGGSAYV